MKYTGLRNQSTYNLTEHRDSNPIKLDVQKAIVKNLTDQSPFREGTKNKDWINPTLSSNVLFYNNQDDQASNHHAKPKRINKKGYNLNHYVAYDAQLKEDQIQSIQRDNENSRKGLQNLNNPIKTQRERSTQRELNERPRSPINSSQRISVERSRSQQANEGKHIEIQNNNQEVHESQKLKSTSSIKIDQKGIKIERKNDRSIRSTSAVHNQEDSKSPSKTRSEQIVFTVEVGQSQEINKTSTISAQRPEGSHSEQRIQRSHSAVSFPNNQAEYLKVTVPTISNPDNLVFDHCINNDIVGNKIQTLQFMREKEAENVKLINENLKKQLEDEKQQQFNKMKMYKNEIESQKMEHENRLRKIKKSKDNENEKIRNMIDFNEQEDHIKIQKLMERKQNYAHDLNEQVLKNYDARQQNHFNQTQAEKEFSNQLFDLNTRELQKKIAKEQYKINLKNQLNDQAKLKDSKRENEQFQNDIYRKKVQEMINQDIENRKQMDLKKKQIFLNEADKHLAMRETHKKQEQEQNNNKIENVIRKMEQDNLKAQESDNLKRLKMKEHVNVLGAQIANRSVDKQLQQTMDKIPTGTTLLIHQKTDRCYNCAKCRQQYPLKLLNKQRGMSKNV